MSKNRFSGLSAMKTLQNSGTSGDTKKHAENANIEPETISESNNNNKMPRRGRPHGKRSNENYRQVTAYIGKDTYKQTKIKLLSGEQPLEFSELVDTLLKQWLKEN